MSRTHLCRLLRLLRMITSGHARDWATIAAYLDVGRRTVFRDLSMLQEAGLPIYFHAGFGYCIAREAPVPPTGLSAAEVFAMAVMRATAVHSLPRPLRDTAAGSIDKCIAAAGGNHLKPAIELAGRYVAGRQQRQQQRSALSPMVLLQQAMDASVRCGVRTAEVISGISGTPGTRSELDFAPYAFFMGHSDWYVLGEIDGQVQPLRLDCIVEVKPGTTAFSRPPRWTVERYRGQAWEIRPEGREYQVKIEFRGPAAYRVASRTWQMTQKIAWHDDQRCTLYAQVDGLKEIAAWLCQFTGEVTIEQPPELIREYQDLLREDVRRQQAYDKPINMPA